MNPFLVQILAMGLTVSQLFSKPVEQFKTHLDPVTDVQLTSKLLKEGCGVLSSQIKDTRFNVEVLLTAMIADAEAEKAAEEKPAQGTPDKLLKKIDFAGLLNAYKLFCKGDKSVADKINLVEVLNYYNGVFKNLKDVRSLRNLKLGEATTVYDGNGKPFTEMYGAGNRRLVVPINKIPNHVKQAFVSAEDQNFYKHQGVDLSGLLRAFTSVVGGGGRPQGGSTITQQVVKNLLINDDLTIERKMREMLLATRLEKVMTKDEILELYLNYVYLGRASWGVEMAARSYFGPQATTANLTVEQAALLAALPKGPTFYNPDRQPERARDRRQYVLTRMREDCESAKKPGCVTAQTINDLAGKTTKTVPFESPTAKGGFYFLDAVAREAKRVSGLNLRAESNHVIKSTVIPGLQRATEQAVRDGLMEYEANSGRKVWTGSQGSIARDIEQNKMKWQEVLPRVQARLYDVPWTIATVLDVTKSQVGLPDGRILPLRTYGSILKRLKTYDIIFVDVAGKDPKQQTATLKIPARVQGSAVVLENQTGKVLAISGGFSYAKSEYNRAMNALRQPGSTLKPFVYLSALNAGLQPNTLLPDMPHDPPLSRRWRPQNYDMRTRGLVTFRTAIEQSLNLPTIQLASRLGGEDPYAGLKYVQDVLKNVGLYKGDVEKRDFAEILGSREVRLIDLATAYATVANSGLRPTPHFVESISRDGRPIYVNNGAKFSRVKDVDRVAFYQLKKILEGTVARGTAVRLKKLEGFVAGKTGTSNNETDAWFVCFTNDITIAVWVGYDDKKIHQNLGGGSTGGRVALPIAERILKATFDLYGKPEKLAGPPDEIRNQITELKIDLKTGSFDGGNFTEVFRVDRGARGPLDTTHALLRPGEERYLIQEGQPSEENAVPLSQASSQPPPLEPRVISEPETQQPPPENRPGIDDNYELMRHRPRQVDPALLETYERVYSPSKR